MQYSIPLPADFAAGQIRERVSARRALFDDHAGLLHKSFIYSESDHLYAPFYVWQDATEARNFLIDDLFAGVVEVFTRHRVRSWVVIEMAYGNRAVNPTAARREIDPIDPEEPLKDLCTCEREAQQKLLKDPNLYLHLLALDADRWELMRYSLWRDAAALPEATSDCCQTYSVLHVSEPKCLAEPVTALRG